MNISQLPGLIGTLLVALAYIPQVYHLIKEHCSAGVSVKAYSLWFIASLLFLIHAVTIMDVVFIGVQFVNLAAICIIVICVKTYEKQACESHRVEHIIHRVGGRDA
jgi:uncharacterized protein with PQ loop repeat